MTSYERPTSIELEVQPKEESQIPLKQREIINDLFDLAKLAGLPHKPIGGFQKNNDGTFTITLNATDQRTKFMTFLSRNQTIGAFIYHPSSADLVGGQLTLLGAPNEYPNHKLHAMMSPYIDIVKIKNGCYKEHPEVRNGVKHLTFKKILKPYPTQMKLPEGYMLKIKTEGADDRPKGCYRCGGNHLIRDWSIELRAKAQQERQPANTYATIVSNNQQAQPNTQPPKPPNTKDERQSNHEQPKTDQNQNTKHIIETTPGNTITTDRNTAHQADPTTGPKTNDKQNQEKQNKNENENRMGRGNPQESESPKGATNKQMDLNNSNESIQSPPPTPSIHTESPEQNHNQREANSQPKNSTYNENSWLHPTNTKEAISSFCARTDQGIPYFTTPNRFEALDQTPNPDDSYFEDQIKPLNTPLKGKIGTDSPVKPQRRSIHNELMYSTPFASYKLSEPRKQNTTHGKCKEPGSADKLPKRQTTGKPRKMKQEPVPYQTAQTPKQNNKQKKCYKK